MHIPPASQGAASRRILTVDDNEDSALSLCGLLVRRGHDAQVAHDGLAALAVAQQFAPDAFLLDLGLPGIDGFQLAADLRRDGFERALFVAISGYAQPADRAHSRRAGFHHHLTKPVEMDRILEVLGSQTPSAQSEPRA